MLVQLFSVTENHNNDSARITVRQFFWALQVESICIAAVATTAPNKSAPMSICVLIKE